jgi:hypothetical protein
MEFGRVGTRPGAVNSQLFPTRIRRWPTGKTENLPVAQPGSGWAKPPQLEGPAGSRLRLHFEQGWFESRIVRIARLCPLIRRDSDSPACSREPQRRQPRCARDVADSRDGMAGPARAARPPSEYRAPAALQGCASRCDGLRFYRGPSDSGVKCSTWVGRIPPPAARQSPPSSRPFNALQGRGAGSGFNTRVRPTPP